MLRRSFLRTAAGILVGAPAIVRAEYIMRIRPIAGPPPLKAPESLLYGGGHPARSVSAFFEIEGDRPVYMAITELGRGARRVVGRETVRLAITASSGFIRPGDALSIGGAVADPIRARSVRRVFPEGP